ncbi:MAG: hypothetical protein OXR73_12775 [Myxococcales bacterium]|nr:hypothetical protein [Myxococcales bacterium]
MKVLVTGSGRHLPSDDGGHVDFEPLRQAAIELGAELARKGHEIAVGSDDPLDVDPYIVEGALQQGAQDISVKVPRGFPVPYENQPHVRKEWSEFPDWDVSTMEAIDKIDAVVLMGGRQGVVLAGTSAWMMHKVVVPIGCFGGGAETVSRYGSSRRARFYHRALTDEEIDRFTSPWGVGLNAETTVAAMEQVQQAAMRERTGTGLVIRTSLTMLAALLAWVLGLVLPFILPSFSGLGTWPPDWYFPLLFPTVIAAGTLGACVKTLRAIRQGSDATGRSATVDTVLGIAAGMMAAILYLLAQIGVAGKVDVAMQANDYARVSIIVSMAALFAGLHLDRAFAYFDSVGESVIKGRHGGRGR